MFENITNNVLYLVRNLLHLLIFILCRLYLFYACLAHWAMCFCTLAIHQCSWHETGVSKEEFASYPHHNSLPYILCMIYLCPYVYLKIYT